MCGRFVIELSPDLVAKVFGLPEVPNLSPRYNVAPTQPAPVIRETPGGQRGLVMVRWGLIPSWSKDSDGGLINARSESVNDKPSFRQSFRQRRCILPASGFYEWARVEGKKVPYYVRMADGSPMPLAGIWDEWRDPNGTLLATCAILTTAANEKVAPIHERMPVILAPESFDQWLNRHVHDAEALRPLCAACPADRIEAFPVSPLVNNPANDAPECILPV